MGYDAISNKGFASLDRQPIEWNGVPQDNAHWDIVVRADFSRREQIVYLFTGSKSPTTNHDDSCAIVMRPEHAVELIAQLRNAHAWNTDDVQTGNIWVCHRCSSVFQRDVPWGAWGEIDLRHCDECEKRPQKRFGKNIMEEQ